MNALTGSHVSVNNRLFETLDPTTRAFSEAGRAYLVTDTVGFIRKLPHQLVEAFAATLEETLSGDLVLLVGDASVSEEELADQLASVRDVLDSIEAEDIPQLLVLNKLDVIDPLSARRLRNLYPDAVQISARTGEGLDELKHRVAEFFADRYVRHAPAAAPRSRRRALGAVCQRRTDHGPRGRAGGRTGDGQAAGPDGRPLRHLSRGRSVSLAVSIARLHPEARIPAAAYVDDAGLDLSSVERVTLAPGERRTMGTDWRSRFRPATPASCSPGPAWPRSAASPSSTRRG